MRPVSKFFCFLLPVVLMCPGLWGGLVQAGENVSLAALDGFPLQAIYDKAGSRLTSQPAVVLLHMFKNKKESWQPLMAELNKSGISSLAIDLRGHGASRHNAAGVDQYFRVTGRDAVFFNQMYQDGLAAVEWLRQKGHGQIAVVGASVGCSVAMHMVAEAKPPVTAIVLMTPGRDYLGINTVSHLERWPGLPLLIMTSKEEAGRGAQTIYDRLQGEGAELVVFDEEGIHGTMMFGEVDGVEGQISSWLTEKFKR